MANKAASQDLSDGLSNLLSFVKKVEEGGEIIPGRKFTKQEAEEFKKKSKEMGLDAKLQELSDVIQKSKDNIKNVNNVGTNPAK